MRMSDKGMLALIRREALVLSAYKDSKGIWTIGVGHTAAAGPPIPRAGLKITEAEGMALLRRDLERYEADVRKAVKVPLAQHEFDALVSFHFNTGGIGRASLTKALNRGDRAEAARLFLSWSKPPEIIDRRREEQRQFLTGDYGRIDKVPVKDKHPGPRRLVAASVLLGTAPSPAAVPPAAPAASAPAHITDPHQVSLVQTWLRNLGYTEVGTPDGKIGPYTKAAVSAYRAAKGLPAGDWIDDELILTLAKDKEPRPVAPERAAADTATVQRVAPEARPTWCAKVWSGVTALGAGAAAVGQGIVSNLQPAREYLQPVQDMLSDVPAWVWLTLAAGIAAYIWSANRRAEAEITAAVQTGARR